MTCKTLIAESGWERADVFVSQTLDITRSSAERLFKENSVLKNGNPIKKRDSVSAGDTLQVIIEDPTPDKAEPQPIPLDIVYEDDDLLVVNKPRGMVVHPAPGNRDGTLVNALLYHCGNSLSGINGVIRPGILHRIDKNTSGLLLVAKNDKAHIFLAEQIKSHSFTREYEAVVYGSFGEKTEGTVDLPIGRHPVKRKQMAVTPKNSKNAVTHYSVIEDYGGFSHIRLRLYTGRTHQIRVHMAYLGHPVAGDDVYGPRRDTTGLGGQCLHAKVIGFIHPSTGEYMQFDSPLPEYFLNFLKKVAAGQQNGD